ncbi:hypothetical protein [Heyndrickxia camelliae]|uniref:Uncharacterized protein n=1 Tax=Heyndrickxia camelliae TaxID=1707093 RepID=A0A2N3LN86_9BACI|nr:hypothetical protein [Heyndrickxia camelliae]PKR86091.1 hypothetical protein CWO92_06890 [Heyndrickxia camelliae]
MDILYWILIGLFIIMVLFGLKNWLRFILYSFAEHGLLAGLLLLIFCVLLIAPSLIKEFAPHYYGYSIWALILYIAGLLFYRWNKTGFKDEEG